MASKITERFDSYGKRKKNWPANKYCREKGTYKDPQTTLTQTMKPIKKSTFTKHSKPNKPAPAQKPKPLTPSTTQYDDNSSSSSDSSNEMDSMTLTELKYLYSNVSSPVLKNGTGANMSPSQKEADTSELFENDIDDDDDDSKGKQITEDFSLLDSDTSTRVPGEITTETMEEMEEQSELYNLIVEEYCEKGEKIVEKYFFAINKTLSKLEAFASAKYYRSCVEQKLQYHKKNGTMDMVWDHLLRELNNIYCKKRCAVQMTLRTRFISE